MGLLKKCPRSSKVKLLHLGKIVGDLQITEEDLARLLAKTKSEEFRAVRLGHRDSRNVVYGAR